MQLKYNQGLEAATFETLDKELGWAITYNYLLLPINAFSLIKLEFLFKEVAEVCSFDWADDNIWTYLVKRI